MAVLYRENACEEQQLQNLSCTYILNLTTWLDSKAPSHVGTNHELYVCAGSRKLQSEICIHLGKMASSHSSGQLSIHCAPVKSCIWSTQFVLSTQLLVQDYGVCFVHCKYIGPVKAGIYLHYRGCLFITSCLTALSWQPNFITVMKYIHYFEHLVVKILSKHTSSSNQEI